MNGSKSYITKRVFTSGNGPTVLWNLSLKGAFSEESGGAELEGFSGPHAMLLVIRERFSLS